MPHAPFDPEEPTNYPDIRESFALALEEEAPEAKEAVLGTVDDAIGQTLNTCISPVINSMQTGKSNRERRSNARRVGHERSAHIRRTVGGNGYRQCHS